MSGSWDRIAITLSRSLPHPTSPYHNILPHQHPASPQLSKNRFSFPPAPCLKFQISSFKFQVSSFKFQVSGLKF